MREGTHRLHGMLALSGAGIRTDFDVCCPRIEDVTPTLMHLLGQPVPTYMDGRVLSEMLSGQAVPRREQIELSSAVTDGAYSDAEVAVVERDLQGLGYL